MIAMLLNYFDGGAYRIKGGYQKLADLIASDLRARGGVLRLKTAVERILVRDGEAVEHEQIDPRLQRHVHVWVLFQCLAADEVLGAHRFEDENFARRERCNGVLRQLAEEVVDRFHLDRLTHERLQLSSVLLRRVHEVQIARAALVEDHHDLGAFLS